MIRKFREAINQAAPWNIILALFVLATGHSTAWDAAAAEGSLVGNRPYSEAISGSLHPVKVITRRDIELSGTKRITDLLGRSAFNSFGLERPLVLGGGRVLILVNGRRVSGSGVDTDMIPISAVERIEIFNDSTSALHGGEAIGGTINIVFKKDYEGLDIQLNAGRPRGEGADSENLGVLWGTSVGEGNLTVGVDIFRRDEVRDIDRDYSRARYQAGGSFVDTEGVSSLGNTVFLVKDDGGKVSGPLGDCDESVYTGELTDPPGGFFGTVCGFAYADIAWHLLRRRDDSAFMNFSYPVGDAADIYIEGRVTKEELRLLYAPEPNVFSVAPDEMLRNSLIESGNFEGLDESNFPESITVGHRFLGHGNRQWDSDLEEYDIALGLRGEIKDSIRYDGYIHYNRYDYAESGHTFINEPIINAAIQSGDYDIQNPLSEAEGHRAAISESSVRSQLKYKTDYVEAGVALDGPLLELMGNKLRWSAGLQVAKKDVSSSEEYFNLSGEPVNADDVLGSSPFSLMADRRRLSAFGDILVPLGNAVDVSVALRHDDFDDVGGAFSHRVATLYRVIPNIALRASWSGGARAPGFSTLHAEEFVYYPYVCDADTPTPDCPRDQVRVVTSGNPELEPDEAESLGAGVSAGWGPFSADFDWFRLRLQETPTTLNTQFVISLERSGRLNEYPGLSVTRSDGRLTEIRNPLTNSGETDMDGFTARLGGDLKTDLANFMLNANWIRITNYERRVGVETQPGDIPRNRIHVLLRADRNDLTMQWNTHAVTSFRNETDTKSFRRWVGHDIALSWRNAFGFNWFELTGGVLNIGNEGQSRPDPDEEHILYLDSILGRTLFLTAKLEI